MWQRTARFLGVFGTGQPYGPVTGLKMQTSKQALFNLQQSVCRWVNIYWQQQTEKGKLTVHTVNLQLCCDIAAAEFNPYASIKGIQWDKLQFLHRSHSFPMKLRAMTSSKNKLQRFSVQDNLRTDSPVHKTVAAVWTAAGPCTPSLSLSTVVVHKAGPGAHHPPLHPLLVKAPGLLMLGVKWWWATGWGGELTRAKLLSTHTHSVQLLLLDQPGSIYKVQSIKEDEAARHHTGCSPEQNIGQCLSPRVTCQGWAGHTESVKDI